MTVRSEWYAIGLDRCEPVGTRSHLSGHISFVERLEVYAQHLEIKCSVTCVHCYYNYTRGNYYLFYVNEIII